jgi:hypothetical protein
VSDWVDQQRALYEGYVSRRVGAERRPVKILWWTVAPGHGPDVMGLVSSMWKGRRTRAAEEQVFVALFDAVDPVGARPFLVVRVGPDSFAEASGRATATAVGRAEPDGALLLETRLGPLAPAEAPGLPGDDAPSWSEVDPPR